MCICIYNFNKIIISYIFLSFLSFPLCTPTLSHCVRQHIFRVCLKGTGLITSLVSSGTFIRCWEQGLAMVWEMHKRLPTTFVKDAHNGCLSIQVSLFSLWGLLWYLASQSTCPETTTTSSSCNFLSDFFPITLLKLGANCWHFTVAYLNLSK